MFLFTNVKLWSMVQSLVLLLVSEGAFSWRLLVSVQRHLYIYRLGFLKKERRSCWLTCCPLIGSAEAWPRRRGRPQVVVNERLPAAEQAGAAGADAAHGRQVRVVEDGQLDGETAPHAETTALLKHLEHSCSPGPPDLDSPLRRVDGVWTRRFPRAPVRGTKLTRRRRDVTC